MHFHRDSVFTLFHSNRFIKRSVWPLMLLLLLCFKGRGQDSQTFDAYLDTLESQIIFNDYITDSVKVQKIYRLIENLNGLDFDKKELLLRYASVNMTLKKKKSDDALYKFVELTEICDTTNYAELRIYLGSLIQISSVLRESIADELSYNYIEKGIKIIERQGLSEYPWIREYYNDAGVDLLSIGDLEATLHFTQTEEMT